MVHPDAAPLRPAAPLWAGLTRTAAAQVISIRDRSILVADYLLTRNTAGTSRRPASKAADATIAVWNGQ